MKLYCIDNKKSPGKALSFLKNACLNLGIDLVEIFAEEFDATCLPMLKPGDAVYRISVDNVSREIEEFLVNKQSITFYNYPVARPGAVPSSHLVLKNSTVPMPKTIPVSTANRNILKKYANSLGGFPLIVKVLGGSQGIGVIKVDSIQTLYSIIDFLNKTTEKYILREFIPTAKSARLIVIGKKVVSSIEYRATSDDFRSNNRIKKENVVPMKYSSEVKKSAIKAVSLRGLEFGGVDIVFDEHGKHYVLEVNFPFAFPDAQEITKKDIALLMVSHLKAKSLNF